LGITFLLKFMFLERLENKDESHLHDRQG
jgi:hypothetical protein